MRILNLTAYYEPEIAASLYIFENICEAYTSAGHEILLYTPMPTRGISDAVTKESIKKYEEKHDSKLKIHRFSMPREGKNPIGRALRYFFCNCAHFYKGLLAKDIDVITIASTPPTQGAMAALLKKFKKVPVVYYLQDIFPDSLVNVGLIKKSSLLWKIGRVLENFTYRNMDKIIVISEDLKQNIMSKGVPENKIEVIYNWVDEKAVVSVAKSQNSLFDVYNLDRNKFYVTYCGNIGYTQNMDMLLEVAKELRNHESIVFVLVGDGAYRMDVEKQIAEKDIQNVKLLPFQPYENISDVFSLGDVGLIISKANIGQNSVPSKTWSIMSAERPILASFDKDGELSSIIETANCGICVQAEDNESLKEAILYLYKNEIKAKVMGRNGRKFIMENLTRDIGTAKYIEALETIMKNREKSDPR